MKAKAALICGRYGGLATADSLVATWALIQSGRTPFASMTTDQRHLRISSSDVCLEPDMGRYQRRSVPLQHLDPTAHR